MDFQTIVFLTIAATLILAILVMAGLVLSAHSFTQLAELIRFIGSLVVQQHQETRQVVTTSSTATEQDTDSDDLADTRTTPENQAGVTTEKFT
jgi:hypothetical protein